MAQVTIDFESANFVPAPDGGLLTTSIMPVIHLRGEKARAIGTCFAISSDGLCLTARHVVEEALPEVFREGRPNTEDDGWLYALYSSGEPHEENPERFIGGLLPVQRAHFNGVLDIAALQLQLLRHVDTYEFLRMPALRLGLAPPIAGELCFALGYHSMEWSSNGADYRVAQRFYGSRGTVEEVHLPRRDAVMAPFPCFRSSARYDGGMSGGPVIGMDGLVKGVVCSSVSGMADADGYVSYASLIGPAVLLQVTRQHEGGIGQHFINDLVQRNVVPVEYQGVSFDRLHNELRLHIGGGTINSILGS